MKLTSPLQHKCLVKMILSMFDARIEPNAVFVLKTTDALSEHSRRLSALGWDDVSMFDGLLDNSG